MEVPFCAGLKLDDIIDSSLWQSSEISMENEPEILWVTSWLDLKR